MSFSFTVRASTLDDAEEMLSAEFDKVVEQQPTHQFDRTAFESAVLDSLSLLRDDEDVEEGKILSITVSGSHTRAADHNDDEFTGFDGISLNLHAAYIFGEATLTPSDDAEKAEAPTDGDAAPE